jgi:hypothetical protein
MHSFDSALGEGSAPRWKLQIMRLLANSLLRANADEVVRHRRSVKITRRFHISVMSLHLFDLSMLMLLGKRSDLSSSINNPTNHHSKATIAHRNNWFSSAGVLQDAVYGATCYSLPPPRGLQTSPLGSPKGTGSQV